MFAILLNIILQLIEGLILYDFYENIKNTTTKFKNFLIVLASYGVMCVINLIFDYNVIINTIAFVVAHFCISNFLYKMNRRFSFLYAILLASVVSVTELGVSETIIVIFNLSAREITSNMYSYIVFIILCKSLLFAILKIVSLIIKKYQSNDRIKFSDLIFPVTLLLNITISGMVTYSPNTSNDIRLMLAVSSFILIITVISTCILQQIQSQKENELLELRAFQQEQEINNTYFDILEHQNNELQIFVHDTKKHYHNLFDLAYEPVKLKEYIKGIVTDIEQANQIGKTSNKLLDLIISKYSYICEKKQIRFEKNIHKSNTEFIEDQDLTAILNNLLDNAIEATEKSNSKTIILGINKIASMLVIDIINSCDVPPLVKNNKLISTKKSEGIHGYGFKSICRTAKKYNGDVEWEYNQDTKEFTVSIIFPIEKHVEQ